MNNQQLPTGSPPDPFGFGPAPFQSKVVIDLRQIRKFLPSAKGRNHPQLSLQKNKYRKRHSLMSKPRQPPRLNATSLVGDLNPDASSFERENRNLSSFQNGLSGMQKMINLWKEKGGRKPEDGSVSKFDSFDFQKYERLFNQPMNVNDIDKELRTLPFFSKYLFYIRTGLYQISKVMLFQRKQVIYSRGDKSGQVYVIIRGSVQLVDQRVVSNSRSSFSGGSQWARFVANTIGDGYNFGEGDGVRDLTAVAAERTILLRLEKQAYLKIVQSHSDDENEQKIKVIKLIPMFRRANPTQVNQFANILKIEVFKLGELVLRRNQVINELFIIMEGKCQVVFQQLVPLRSCKGPALASGRPNTSGRPLTSGGSSGPRSRQVDAGIATSTRKFDFTVEQAQGQACYRQHIVFGQLQKGEIVGARAVLNVQTLKKKADMFKESALFDQPNRVRLSMIAATSKVVVCKVSKEKVLSLPQSLLNMLFEELIYLKEFDDYQVEKRVQEERTWRAYKERICSRFTKLR